MAFLDEKGLQRLVNNINVRSSTTLPDNAPDGTIIINPDEDTDAINIDSINVDSSLSLTSENPVQNKVVTKELEKIPCKLTIECVAFDGNEVNPGDIATGCINLSLNEDKNYNTMDPDSPFPSELTFVESYSLRKKIEKTVYNNTPYKIHVFQNRGIIPIGEYYEPDETDLTGIITGDTNIVITFWKKREPVTLTINLKDKNGNFICDDVSVIDSFDPLRKEKIVGTYGKTAGSFTVQVTKGYDYEIKPLLKGYNNKEDNSPAEPDQTSINGTANNDETIDITYNKIYPDDFGTAWVDLHKTISENQGVEVLPIGTELSTYVIDTNEGGTAYIPINFHIVNWRYAEKEDGAQVWGCDLLSTGLALPFLTSGANFFNSDASTTMNGWEDSAFRAIFNNSAIMSTIYPVDFLKYLQKVKVTSSITKDTQVYTYDTMWLPSATEMYINTSKTTGSYAFTNVVEGNNNEKYWKNIIKASSKFDPSIANNKLIDLNASEPDSHFNYWLRSCTFMLTANPSGDNTYSYQKEIWYVTNKGKMEHIIGSTSSANARVMCFFA